MSTLKMTLLLAGVFIGGCTDKNDDSGNAGSVEQVDPAPTCDEIPCADGFSCVDVDGDLACENIDECADELDDCGEGYTCEDTEGSFTCSNINECTDGSAECEDGFACTDTDGSYTCENVDECAEGTAECDDGFACADTDGSYTCENVDECADGTYECDSGLACLDTEGSYTCVNVDECADGSAEGVCPAGYGCSDTEDSFTCVNIDECADGTDDCEAGFTCSDTLGSFTCDNIDECADGTDDCEAGFTCSDTPGSFTCDNVDECAEGTDDCTDGFACSDTPGSFTCDNIDECAEGTDDCTRGYACADTEGSFTCDNIDECAEGTVGCADGWTCEDTDGSFTCDIVYSELGEQLATLEIDHAAGTVTVVAQPDNFTLSDALLSETGTFDLTVENGMDRLVFNLKAVVDSVSVGSIGEVSLSVLEGTGWLWTDGDKPYVSYGGLSLLPGDSRTESIAQAVTYPGDVVTVELHFIDAPMLLLGQYGYDSVDTSMAATESYGEHDGETRGRQRAISPNGRFVYTGGKNSAEIDVHDTSSGDWTTWDFGEGSEGSIAGLAVSADGAHVYALMSDGRHYNGGDGGTDGTYGGAEAVALLELDALTMEVTRRLDVHSWEGGDPESRMARYLAWSPGMDVLAASLGSGGNGYRSSSNELWFIDVETMTAIDTNPDTADVADPVVLPAQGYGEQMVWEGGYVIVGHNTKNAPEDYSMAQLSFVDGATYEVTTVTPPEGHGAKAGVMSTSPGVLYYSSRDGDSEGMFSAFDIATQEVIYSVDTDRSFVYAMYVPRSGYIFGGDRDDNAWVFDAATGEAVDADGDPENGISAIDHEWSGGHSTVMTPF
jgi:hypothetical protein